MNKTEIIINKTPHPVYILEDKTHRVIRMFPKSKGMIRVVETTKERESILGIPICSTRWGETTDVPAPMDGTYYIVSQLVKNALSHRPDLLVPKRVIRDRAGNIIGCLRLDIGVLK